MRNELKVMAIIVAIVIVGVFIGSRYYRSSIESGRPPVPQKEGLIREDSPTLGPADAKVTIVEFLDPECETCAVFGAIVKKIVKDNDPNIRLVIRYMPLHPNAARAATFVEAAGEQGKYWEALDLLFQKLPEWGERHGAPPNAPKPDIDALFERYAQTLGLDLKKLETAVKENRFAAKLDRDKRDGQRLGVRKTPSFFVNGRELTRFGEAELRALIADELKK
ncbi:MAG: thioredoxin domain-containing protein [Pyrinomonadaceae bacterium]